jgi:hypothetical protein
MAKAGTGKKTRGKTTQAEMTKEKAGKKTQEATQFENIDQTVQRVKKDMLRVGASIVVSAAIGLIAGQLIKF